MINAKTYRTADRFALCLTSHGTSLAKNARATKRDRKLAFKKNRKGVSA